MTSITALFPCKKLRRSSRLEMKEKVESKEKNLNSSSVAYFEILPLEVKFMLFTYLTVKELSVLTITSKSVRNAIELYRGSGFAQPYILPYTVRHSTQVSSQEQEKYSAQFQNIGLLIKRSTCLYSTRDRLKFVEHFLQKLLCSVHKECTDPVKCIALSCLGKFFHMVIAGWDDKECTKAYEVICQTSVMAKHICTVIKSGQGTYPGLELQVRLFFRRVFLQHCLGNYDKAFWLELILKPFPMVHQARILFLLFGPIHGDEIQWSDMCESTPGTKDQAKHCFGDLSNAFRVLHHYSKQWNEDDIISVLEELTISPEEWLSENTANLLYLCGECITLKVLSSKAINGRMAELANILTSLSVVCVRYDNNISFVTKLITLLCPIFENPKERVSFLHSIVDTFKETILDIHEFSDGDEDSTRDLHFMLEAQSEFTKELLLLAFKAQGVVLNLKPILTFKEAHSIEE